MTDNAENADYVEWWVVTAPLDRYGRKIAGPFPSSTDARIARDRIEATQSRHDFWIDREPVNPGEPWNQRMDRLNP